MNELELTGGARIGKANATYPLATLKVNKNRLELNASVVGNLTFQASDIVSIEPYMLIPILGQGIKINHNVSNYKERVIFWTFKNPKSVVRQIRETGFLNNTNTNDRKVDRDVLRRQSKGGVPIKKGYVIGAIVIWNLLFLSDFIPFFLGEKDGVLIGNGVLSAIGLSFLTAFLSLVSGGFRKLVLKEGRELNDIKKFAILVMVISGILLFQIAFMIK